MVSSIDFLIAKKDGSVSWMETLTATKTALMAQVSEKVWIYGLPILELVLPRRARPKIDGEAAWSNGWVDLHHHGL
jgi:hypothetical protein